MRAESPLAHEFFSPRALRVPVASRSLIGTALFRLTLALAAATLALATTALFLAGRSLTVGAGAPVHSFDALGRTIAYPQANPSALIVLALAALGLVVLLRALRSVGHQALAQRALARSLASSHLRDVGEVAVIEGEEPSAMCAGLTRPRIYVTEAALDTL